MVASTAALALPRSAGAATRTLSVSPSHPATQLCEDPGITLTWSLIVAPPIAVEPRSLLRQIFTTSCLYAHDEPVGRASCGGSGSSKYSRLAVQA